MKAHIQIPNGFSPVRSEFLKPTDRIVDVGNYWDEMKWIPAKDWEAFKAGDRWTSHYPLAIRRTQRPKKWAPKGWREISFVEWMCNGLSPEDNSLAYSLVGERKLTPYSATMFLRSDEVRFWLRRGAK